jgi:hypothetical protein
MRDWINQLAVNIMVFHAVNGHDTKTQFDKMKILIDECTGGIFSYLTDTARRDHVEEVVIDRLEEQEHLLYAFRSQCSIRSCQFDCAEPKDLIEHLQESHCMIEERAINVKMEAIIQLYGDELI